MPEIYVHMTEGRSQEQKRALMQDITQAVVKHCKVEQANVVVTVVEAPKVNKMKNGMLFSER